MQINGYLLDMDAGKYTAVLIPITRNFWNLGPYA